MTFESVLVQLLGPSGLLVLLLIIVVGAVREWWHTGSAYRRLEADRNKWQDLALSLLNTADRAVKLVEPP